MNNDSVKKVFNLFLIGVLAFLPVFLVVQIVIFVKHLMSTAYGMVFGYTDNAFLTLVLFVFSFLAFTYIGYRVKVGKSSIIALIDAVIERIPLLNTVYRVTKKIVDMFSGHGQQGMREVVYIEYPKDGIWVPAYVTNKNKEMYILFIPTSPNPTSGFTVIVHESKVVKSKMDIEEATSFIVSVGVDFNRVDEINHLP
ncbi:MAG: DUF502 domain-containing protein [Methylococcales bacterium]|jgi:uncharacterized membrane protein|nr:DUF502 domain-containing protein [Methylococcales bacterium]